MKLRIPIMHRHFFRKFSQNIDYIQTYCNDRRNPFHFACRQWYNYTFSNTNTKTFISTHIIVSISLV